MNKKIPSLGLVVLFIIIGLDGCIENHESISTNINWEKTYDGHNYDDEALSVATDAKGNIYIVGYTSNVSGTKDRDWWIKKFDAHGNEDTTNWNKVIIQKDHTAEAESVATDVNGNIYVVGWGFDLSMHPDDKGGQTADDWWIKKFDSRGNEDINRWNKTYDFYGGNDRALSVAVDTNGNIYVVGYTEEIQFPNTIPYVCIKKFNQEGAEDTIHWNKTFKGGYTTAITTDGDGNIYFVGIRADDMNELYGSIIKFDAEGNQLWTKEYHGNGNWFFSPTSVFVDDTKSVYIAGIRGKSGEINMDWWIKKFDKDGNEDTINWNKTYDAAGDTDMATSIVSDSNGKLYISGFGTNLTGNNGQDWWIKQFNKNGTQLWEDKDDGAHGDDCCWSLAADKNGGVYAVGFGENLNGSTHRDWWIKKIVFV